MKRNLFLYTACVSLMVCSPSLLSMIRDPEKRQEIVQPSIPTIQLYVEHPIQQRPTPRIVSIQSIPAKKPEIWCIPVTILACKK